MRPDRYKMVPGVYHNYQLLRWVGFPFFGYWTTEAYSDSAKDLIERVAMCGGRFVFPPTPSNQEGEGR